MTTRRTNEHRRQFRATRVVYRFVSGRHLSSQPSTNATWAHRADRTLVSRPGDKMTRWASAPGYYRQAWRLGTVSATVASTVGYVTHPIATELTLSGMAVAGATYGSFKIARTMRTWQRTRKVVRPLMEALSPFVQLSVEKIASRIIVPETVEGNAQIPLPDHFAGRQAEIADITRIFTQRVGGEWDSAIQLRARPFYLALTPRPAPPTSVTFDMIRDYCVNTTQDKPFLGLGARSDAIYLDFTGEIAHLAASIGTGGGKSSFLRFLIAQFAHHGVRDFTVADVKWVSLQGMEDVPGLTIHRDVEDIWDALAMDRAEMDRRYKVMLANPKVKFPRKVIVMEEQNAFALETSIRWREVREKGDKRALAPVWNDIALLLVKARQVNMNIIGVYQRMSAEASGGGTYRDQYGLKLLSRFSPAAWDSLVATKPRGVSSALPGRAIAVLGGSIRAVQLPFITVEDALAFATSGPAVDLSSLKVDAQSPLVRASKTATTTTAGPVPVTLREAVESGLVTGKLATVAKRMERDSDSPKAVGKIGKALLYNRNELVAWNEYVGVK